jgi:hypothetical protein
MANPQRSGWRSEIRVCACGLGELERSVLVIFSRPMLRTSDGKILLESRSWCH